ncbi:MAG: energy-coupling factor transporter transmembrane component T [Suipraeoptans sp.]
MMQLSKGFGGSASAGFHIDPRTKLIIMLVTGICAFMNSNAFVEIAFAVVATLLLLSCGKTKTSFKLALFFSVLLCTQVFLVPKLPGMVSGVVYMFSVYLRKLLPCVMLGNYLISTTHASEFLAALNRMHLPKGLTIALAITLRYFPTMGEEWRSIQAAMAMRGIGGGIGGFILHPIATMEYIYVPMLVSASKISDEITQAAITRGIESENKRSCVTQIRITVADVFMLFLYTALVVALIYVNNTPGFPGGI